ncbi:LysR family transcriptional regulator [Gimesia chilikensis]|uniref:HTH-type transcriptional regulator CysL n=1 Tax=Gimesia chilikensis TaxID=2605989 RepID=A0A517W7H4_9PLAN|nr:LysR family transcriptional regulator [Gimesia chilikensis]KAA0137311.1 LysR family transcriptional regulator [Gimesia chilikensis]QDU01214.1 HTH-type transcriptional regulator CysL [Gimesia chilikensis]
MHLRNAELFCDVVVHGSFSKAAEVRRVSQSAASQAVHALEKRLGAQLIDRSKRPFELTPAGSIYFDGCQQLLRSFEQVEEQVRRAIGQTKNRVRIAAIYSVGLAQMHDYVEQFQHLYPEVMINLDYLHPDEVYQRVSENQADLGLVSFPKEDKDLTSILWQEQPMVLVVYPGHRLADQVSCEVGDIENEPFVAFTSELVVRQKMDRWLKKAGVHVQLIHEFDNIENIKRAVEAEAGIAILPLPTVSREVQDQSLKIVRLEQVEWFRPIGIIQRKQKSVPDDVVSKFIEVLHENPANFSSAHRETTEGSASAGENSSSMDAFSFGPLIARE